MEYFKFEEMYFKSKGIDLFEIIECNEKNNHFFLNKKKLQIYWEIKPIIYVYRNITVMENLSNHISEKILYDYRFNDYVESCLSIIDNYFLMNNINLNVKLFYKQLISTLFVIAFGNKLIVEINDEEFLYINKYNIINDVINNLNKFFIFFDENNLRDIMSKEKVKQQKRFIDYILNVFREYELVVKKNKKSKNLENFDEEEFTTQTYLSLNNKNTKYSNENIVLKIFFYKLNIITYANNNYYKSIHYLSTSEIFRPNISSRKIFILNENMNTIQKLRNTEYNINEDLFMKIYNKILKDYSLENTNDIIVEETLYKKYLDTLESSTYSLSAQRESSKLYFSLIFIYLKKYKLIFKESFYLSYFFDFRGRMYSDSIISPIGFKWFRYLYNYGFYESHELENIKFYNENDSKIYFFKILKNTNIIELYPNLAIELKKNIFVLPLCFFEIGKIYKSKYIKNYSNKLTYQDFIDIGIKEYNLNVNKNNNFEQHFDFEDDLELIYILNILDSWNKKIYRKFIIWKDATASAIQMQMIIHNSTDENNYKYTNLIDDGYWYDTYSYIIDWFLNEVKKKELILKLCIKHKIELLDIKNLNYDEEYFNRKTLKKTMMTYNYSATLWTCYNEFMLQNNKHKEKKNKFLYIEFCIFYYYLGYLFNESNFFKKTSIDKLNDRLIMMIAEEYFNLNTPDESEVSYDYYEAYSRRNDVILRGKRYTTSFRYFKDSIDKKKIETAFKPNYTHSLDASLLRFIIMLYNGPIITIHDSCGIDILQVYVLVYTAIVAANEMNKKSDIRITSKNLYL